jgi:hypothetical protein
VYSLQIQYNPRFDLANTTTCLAWQVWQRDIGASARLSDPLGMG